MKQEMYDAMYLIEGKHWWFQGKHNIVSALLKKRFQSTPFCLADIGCGTGMTIHRLSNSFQNATITGMDFSSDALAYCKKSFSGSLVQVDLSQKQKDVKQYDCILALDLLEHIEKDEYAAKNIYNFLLTNGMAIFTVPAFPFLWSKHDENCMNIRRYKKEQLRHLLQAAGFTVKFISYYNFFMFFPMLLVRTVSRLFRINKQSAVENTIPFAPINSLLTTAFSAERHWLAAERHWLAAGKHFPFGGSLICVAVK